MDRELETMSLEELWQLFPIFLVEHNREWARWYDEEVKAIFSLVPEKYITRISHIGSTAIPNIQAKNIVEPVKNILVENNWLCMSQKAKRISLNKGYAKQGFADKVFHLHIRVVRDNDEIYFRDYLIENGDIAKQYEKLKLKLWKEFEHDRDGYTDAKSDFIRKYTKIAREKYGSKNRSS